MKKLSVLFSVILIASILMLGFSPVFISADTIVGDSGYQSFALGVLDGNSSVVTDLNNHGQCVGFAHDGRQGTYEHAFIWQDGVMTDLGNLLGVSSSANALNNIGWVVGEADGEAYLFKKNVKISLGMMSGVSSTALDINNNNYIVGNVTLADGTTRAFLWKNGNMMELPTGGNISTSANMMNDRNQILGGYLDAAGNNRGCLWQNGKFIDLGTLGGSKTYPLAMNNNGQIVGSSETADGRLHAFLWQHGKMRDLGTLGGSNSEATSINDNGVIVGNTEDAAEMTGSFIWKNNKMNRLSGFTDKTFESPSFINDKDQVVGIFHSVDGYRPHAFLWKNGKVFDLDLLGYFTSAVKINNRGMIIANGRAHVGGYGDAYIYLKIDK